MSRVVVILVAVFSSTSFGQIIYEPVRYQHGQDVKYFYGGSSRLAHEYAQREIAQRSYYGYGLFSGSDRTREHELFSGQRELVFTDDLPLREVSRFGYTANDAHNEAMANMPRYWRKAELLAAGEVQDDGSVVVPADVKVAGRAYMRAENPTTRPATTKGAIIIIPKKLLDKKLNGDDGRVALAR